MRKLHFLASSALTLGLITSMTGLAVAEPSADLAPANPSPVVGVDAAVPYTESERAQNWEKLKFGMFIHWGVYSNFGGYYKGQRQPLGYPEQIKAWSKISDEDYLAEAAQMNAPEFDAHEWCQNAKDAGMKYLVITSKHHDGFAMWDTNTTDYNVVDKTDIGLDPLEELSTACADVGLKFGVYFSIIDWTKHEAEPYSNMNKIPESMMPYIKSQLTELMTRYGEIAEVWFDMGAPTADQSERMANWVHELQPNAMVSSRVWNNKGDFEVGGDNAVFSQKRQAPWEAARSTFPTCWGYCKWPEIENKRQNPAQLTYQIQHEVNNLFTTVANGGQYLLNIGPKGTGEMDPFEVNILKGVGEWNKAHPAILNGSRYARFPQENWGYAVVNDNAVYLGVTDGWAPDKTIQLRGLSSTVKSVTIDGTDTELPFTHEGTTLTVTLKGNSPDANLPVIKVETEGKPLYLSEKTVTSDNGTFTATEENAESMPSTLGYSGDVSHTVYLTAKDNAVMDATATVTSNALKDQTMYALTVGDTRMEVTGAQLKAGVEIGALAANTATPVMLSLANPPYYATPLGIDTFQMDVKGTVTKVVTPEAPTVVPADKCGVEQTVKLPTQEGVTYTTEKTNSTVHVTASVAKDYMVKDGATVEWDLSVAAQPCPVTPAKPVTPGKVEQSKKSADGKYIVAKGIARTGANNLTGLIALSFIVGATALTVVSRKRR